MFFSYSAVTARASYLIDEILETLRRVLHGKRLSDNITIAVTEHDHMVLFGIIDRHAHHFGTVSRLFKKTKKLLTLIRINGSLFHGEAPLSCAAASLQTALYIMSPAKPDGY